MPDLDSLATGSPATWSPTILKATNPDLRAPLFAAIPHTKPQDQHMKGEG